MKTPDTLPDVLLPEPYIFKWGRLTLNRLLAAAQLVAMAMVFSLPALYSESIDLTERAAVEGWEGRVEHVWGPTGKAWRFHGKGDDAILVDGLKFPREYTFESWIKFDPDAVDGRATLLSGDQQRRFRLMITEGETLILECRNVEKGYSRYQCAYEFVPGRWYHVAVSMGADDGVAFYINGRLVKAQPGPIPAMGDFPIGALGVFSVAPETFDHPFRGSMGGARLHSQILAPTDILESFQKGGKVPEIVPIPRSVQLLPGEAGGFPLKGPLAVSLEGGVMNENDPVLVEFLENWQTHCGGPATIVQDVPGSTKRLVVKQADVLREGGEQALEAYHLRISPESIEVEAGSKRGAAYALYTLMALMQESETELSAMEIRDWPEFSFRGFLYLCHREPPAMLEPGFDQEMKKLIPKLARHRVNHLMVRTADWIMLDDPKVEQAARSLVEYARRHHVEIVPLNRSYGHAKHFLWKDLRTGHTDTVQAEKIRLSGTDPVALKVPNVIVTQHTPIVVQSGDGKTYVEGKDYSVLEGELKTKWKHPPGTPSSWSRPYVLPENKPWQIQRISGGEIQDGETVAVTYDTARVMQGQGHGSYNPFSEFTRKIQSDSIAKMSKITNGSLLPTRYINFGLDEVWLIRTEGRSSTHNDWSNEKTFSYEINLLDQETRSGNPNQRMMMWSDMLDPRQTPSWRATLDYASIMASDLSREVILMPWYYGTASDEVSKMKGTIRYLVKEGFDVVGTSGHDPLNNLLWGEILFRAKHELGARIPGLLYTTWAGGGGDLMGGLPAFAQATWSPGEVRITNAARLVELLRQAGLDSTPGEGRRESISEAKIGNLKELGVIPLRIRATLAETEQDVLEMGDERVAVLKKVGFDIPFYISIAEAFEKNAGKR